MRAEFWGCPDCPPRLDATHCYTAEEFGEADAKVCERHPMVWRECNQWTSTSYQTKRIRFPKSASVFDPLLTPFVRYAFESAWRDGRYLGLRLRGDFRADEYWPDIPAMEVTP